jgi:hypothetical protein
MLAAGSWSSATVALLVVATLAGGCELVGGIEERRTGRGTGAGGTGGAPPCADGDPTCDPHNCGQAGHDCLAGACVDGQCQPFALVGLTTPGPRVALSSTRVYFVDEGGNALKSCSKETCKPEPLVHYRDAHGANLANLVTDGTRILFSGRTSLGTQLGSCLLTAEMCIPSWALPAQTAIAGIAIGPELDYFTVPAQGTTPGVVWEINLASEAKLFALATDPRSIAVAQSKAYWIDAGGPTLESCPLSTCSSSIFLAKAARAGSPLELRTIAGIDTLFWAHESQGVVACSVLGGLCQPVRVGAFDAPVIGLGVDPVSVGHDPYVYFSPADPADPVAVYRTHLAAKSDEPPVAVVRGAGRAQLFVSDGSMIFWVDVVNQQLLAMVR